LDILVKQIFIYKLIQHLSRIFLSKSPTNQTLFVHGPLIYPVLSHIVSIIDPLEFAFSDEFEFGTKYGIPNSKNERK